MASSFRDCFGRRAPSCLALAWAGGAAPVPTTVRLGACNCLHSPALFSALCPGASLSKAILKMLAQASHGGQTMRRFLNPFAQALFPRASRALDTLRPVKLARWHLQRNTILRWTCTGTPWAAAGVLGRLSARVHCTARSPHRVAFFRSSTYECSVIPATSALGEWWEWLTE
jgi:hypothetical protein